MNNDDQQPTQPINQFSTNPDSTVATKQPKKSKKTKILVWLIIIALLAGNIALGYLYYVQTKEITDLKKQLDSAQQVKNEPATSAPTASDTKTSYTATVGKFTLALPDNYVIIKKLDGGFEGGPGTILQVTQFLDEAKGVVGSDNPFSELKITALPTPNFEGSDGLSSFMESLLQGTSMSELESKPDVTIDGVTAKVYGFNGLSYIEWYVFENNGIYYGVEVAGADQEPSKSIIKEVIAGFSFN